MNVRPQIKPGRATDTSTLAFATRLALAVAVTFAVVGGAGYFVIVNQLHVN